MAHIQQLAPHVADLIAAGEVVERPASVVKELVENAIDAGATAVVVEIRRGGMGLIRVTDNGCGIAPQELATAFLRHATSKMRSAEDLGRIGTLGFRGEALAAISAVSRVEILTRQKGAAAGASLQLEGGVPGEVQEAGAPEGTTMMVRDLFYNTPARLKFMKKDSAETAAVSGLLQHLALSHPQISFVFIKDGTEALHTPGDGKLESAVYAALGREFARSLIPVEGCGGDTAVTGFVTAPLMGRGSRSMQVFFVNGRFIKSQLLTAALEEGYRNQIMKGKFPGCVLCVTVPVTAVDVNVHPAKTQVKFAREREVFDAVYHTVLDCLAAKGAPVPAAKSAQQVMNPRQDFFQTMDAKTYREQGTKPAPKMAARPTAESVRPAAPARPVWDTERGASTRVADSAPQSDFYRLARPLEKPAGSAFGSAPASVIPKTKPAEEKGAAAPEPVNPARSAAPAIPEGTHLPVRQPTPARKPLPSVLEERGRKAETNSEKPADMMAGQSRLSGTSLDRPDGSISDQSRLSGTSLDRPDGMMSGQPRPSGTGLGRPDGMMSGQQTLEPEGEAPWRIAGEILHTYIICESADGCVWLIDKHAAHERINFDRMKAAVEPPMRQTLLVPIAAELTREDGALLLEHLGLLEQFGFACEDFGGDTLLVREVPADLDTGDVNATLEEFAENLRMGRSVEEKRENLLHTMACKAAIKGGWVSDPAELKVLVEQVQSGAVRYCPHGRPVAVKLTKYELEKMFKRA